jgi:DNA replication protein DnaC
MGQCKKCLDGWIENKPCNCRKIFVYLKELYYSKIPEEYWNLEWNKIDISPKTIKTLIKKYLDNFENAKKKGKGVCFIGTNGIGKTTLLCEIGKRSVQLGLETFYTTAQSYIDYKMVGNSEILERIEEKTKVLLLDELDKPYKKKGSNYVPAKIEELFRKLLPKNIIICVASNFSEKEIEDAFGDSVFSIMKRKIKFLTLLGDDISDYLQDDWEEGLIEKDSIFLSDYFIDMAKNFKREYK